MGHFHLRFEATHAVVVVDAAGNDVRSVELAVRGAARVQGLMLVVGERAGRVVVLLECARHEQLEAFCQALVSAARPLDAPIRIGPSPLRQAAASLDRAYDQALEALALLPALGPGRAVAHFDELGILHWLHALPPGLLEENAYARMLQRLIEHDRTHSG